MDRKKHLIRLIHSAPEPQLIIALAAAYTLRLYRSIPARQPPPKAHWVKPHYERY